MVHLVSQDLSVAGKRAGLAGERSGLFMEQIRIIKEMREQDEQNGRTGKDIRPRYMVWENVCFVGDTYITCEDGYKPISEINIGDKVKTHTGRYMPVVKTYKHQDKSVVKVQISGGESLIVTPNHPVYAIEKKYDSNRRRQFTQPEWIPIKDLTKYHLIGYKIDTPTLLDTALTEKQAWAIGRYLADGSLDLSKSNPRIFISCGINKVESTREALSGLPYSIHENKVHKTAVNFCFTSQEFYSYIEQCGRGAGYKKVAPYIFQLPINLQKQILDGYISGDGHIRSRGNAVELSAGTASRKLAYGIARLIRNVYHVSANISKHQIQKTPEIDGRKLKVNFPTYTISASLTNKVTVAYYDETNNIMWQPVKSITEIEEPTTVYNLSVLEDNTYAANDIIVHNCGAFSSNKGKDFRAVLEETVKIVSKDAVIPEPPKGKWTPSGCIMGDGWSVAWRTTDNQYWGTPQRRRRISLVADFGGQSAPQVLFECEGLSGNIEQSKEKRERITETLGGSIDETGTTVTGLDCYNQNETGNVTHPIRSKSADSDHIPCIVQEQPILLESNQNHATVQTDGVCTALPASMGMGGGYVPMITDKNSSLQQDNEGNSIAYGFDSYNQSINKEKSETLRTCAGGDNYPKVVYGICSDGSNSMRSSNPNSGIYEADTSRTLDNNGGNPACNQGGMAIVQPLTYDARGNGDGKTVNTLTGDHQNRVTDYTALCVNNKEGCTWDEKQVSSTLTANNAGGQQRMPDKENFNAVITPSENNTVVRRLTPLECERLQGFPNNWTNIGDWVDSKGKKHKGDADTPRYKALGNSLALPFWYWLSRRIVAQYDRPVTMASLFDGISGFPLVFQSAGCTPVWSSEIEEFPIAVATIHFGDDDKGIKGDYEKYL